MATETRHAAWQDERSFAVRLLPEEGPPEELVGGLSEFLDAVDFAVEWLAREDPERAGTTSLAIFETRGGEAEKVWAYPPEQPRSTEPLMKIFGFDPVNWKSAAVEFAPREPARGTFFPRPAETAPPASPRSAPVAPRALPSPPQPIAVLAADETRPQTSHTRLEPRRALAAAWDDPVSRSFLFLAGVSLWLSLAFSDASALAFLLVALSGLWWRRGKLVGTAETDGEDWM